MRISSSNKPLIAVTMGDPSGVGPEVTVKALASLRGSKLADFFVIGDSFVLEKMKKSLGVKIDIPLFDMVNVRPRGFAFSKINPEYGKASMDYIDRALELLNNGSVDAMVTAPVNKAAIHSAGYTHFTGHTEYLAEHTGTKEFAMMFVGGSSKITLVTRHVALKDVPRALTIAKISTAIKLTDKALKDWFSIKNPRVGVAGLNPHAGEGGMFGNEEAKAIIPAMKAVSGTVKGLTGPVPPDVIFYKLIKGDYDAVISMYHDQALIPFKTLYFDSGVNLTLGLPFVRTSPDHGTAFDIAGKGKANPESMIEAMKLAARLAVKC
jgi:4-hydroxythreonine-4-phosphate dehydrogenase